MSAAKPNTPRDESQMLKGPNAKLLRDAAHASALLMEPTSDFPGVDIDRIHYLRGAVRLKEAA